VLTHAQVERIGGDGVSVVVQGERRLPPADTVAVVGPRRSVNDLASSLGFSVDELYTVGDAVLPRAVANAVREGFRVGNAI